jgi:hypothetical protein
LTSRRPIWGYFALASVSLALGVFLLVLSSADAIPAKANLKKITGVVKTVVVVDDLSEQLTPLPAFNAIHFTLQGNDALFRYPNRWPGYTALYHGVAFDVDVWVDPQSLNGDEPVLIYRLEQRVPEDWATPPISIDYEAIVETDIRSRRSYGEGAFGLLITSAALWVVGVYRVRSYRGVR